MPLHDQYRGFDVTAEQCAVSGMISVTWQHPNGPTRRGTDFGAFPQTEREAVDLAHDMIDDEWATAANVAVATLADEGIVGPNLAVKY